MATTYAGVSRNPALTRGLRTAAEKDAAVHALINVAHDGGLSGIMEGIRSHDGHTALAALRAHESLCNNAGSGYLDKAVAAGVADAMFASYLNVCDKMAQRTAFVTSDSEGDDSDWSYDSE